MFIRSLGFFSVFFLFFLKSKALHTRAGVNVVFGEVEIMSIIDFVYHVALKRLKYGVKTCMRRQKMNGTLVYDNG